MNVKKGMSGAVKGKSHRSDSIVAATPTELNIAVALSDTDRTMTAFLTTVAQLVGVITAPSDMARLYDALDKKWKKALESTREELRARLLELIPESAEGARPTSIVIEVPGYKLRRQVSYSSQPAEQRLRELATLKGMDPMMMLDQEIRYVASSSKLHNLIAEGKLTEAEVESCKEKKATALYVESL